MEDKLTIQEQIEEYLSSLPKETIITTGSFQKILSKTYGQPEASYIPSDYCYNSYCKGSQWDKQKIFYFEKLEKKVNLNILEEIIHIQVKFIIKITQSMELGFKVFSQKNSFKV